MKIAFANDHSGFPMRKDVLDVLTALSIEIIDHGSNTPDRVDFPDLARKVCHSIRGGGADRGIMLCGTGIGAAIAANKIPGIRACVCHDVHSAHQGVEHDDMNSTDEYFRQRASKLDIMELEAARELKDRI
jgi:ribose 5-phosphate isomerase B